MVSQLSKLLKQAMVLQNLLLDSSTAPQHISLPRLVMDSNNKLLKMVTANNLHMVKPLRLDMDSLLNLLAMAKLSCHEVMVSRAANLTKPNRLATARPLNSKVTDRAVMDLKADMAKPHKATVSKARALRADTANLNRMAMDNLRRAGTAANLHRAHMVRA